MKNSPIALRHISQLLETVVID